MRLAPSSLCNTLSPMLVPIVTSLHPPSVLLGLLPWLLLLLMCSCTDNSFASPFPVVLLTEVTCRLLYLLGTLMGIATLLGHQISMKISLKFGRIIHLIPITQLGSDQMEI